MVHYVYDVIQNDETLKAKGKGVPGYMDCISLACISPFKLYMMPLFNPELK